MNHPNHVNSGTALLRTRWKNAVTSLRFYAIHACQAQKTMQPFKTYMCLICGFIYDEAHGLPDEGIAPGTRWEDIPPNWACPECGARKDDFEIVEI